LDLCTDAFQDWNTASLAKFQPLLSTVTKAFGISLYFKKLIDLGHNGSRSAILRMSL
jgi:hypothetical protein